MKKILLKYLPIVLLVCSCGKFNLLESDNDLKEANSFDLGDYTSVTNVGGTSFTGSCLPGSTLSVEMGLGVEAEPVDCPSSGVFTLPVTYPNGDGDYSFDIIQTPQGGGDAAVFPVSVTVDTIAPIAGTDFSIPSPTAGSDVSSPGVVEVACSEGDIIMIDAANSVNVGSVSPSSMTCPAGESVNFSVPTIADGATTLAVTSTDAAGNLSNPGTSVAYISDSTAPVAGVDFDITTPTIGSSVTSPVAVSLTCVDGDEVSITGAANVDTAGATPSSVICAGGVANFSVPSLGIGSAVLEVSSTDPAGNTSTTPASVSIDFVNFSLASSVNPLTSLNGPLSLSGACSDSDGSVSIACPGASVTPVSATCSGGAYSTTCTYATGVAIPTETITATQGMNSATNDILVDTAGPAGRATITSPRLPEVSNDNAIAIVGSCGADAANGNVIIKTDPQNGFSAYPGSLSLDGSGGFNLTGVTWVDGTYDLIIECSDAVGNPGTRQGRFSSITIDTQTPLAPMIVKPLDGSTINDNTPTVSGIAGSVEGDTSITVTGPSGSTCTTTSASDGSYSCDLSPALPELGPHTISVTQTDAAGNTSDAGTTSISIDTGIPVAAIISAPVEGSIINDNTPTVSGIAGSAEADASITVTGPKGETCTTTVASDGSYSCDLSPALAEGGPQSLSIVQTDAGGNASPAATVNVSIDTIEPTIAITSSRSGRVGITAIPITITFSEDVTGFDINDIVVTNGTISNFTGGPSVYTAELLSSSTGEVTADIAAGATTDAGANGNEVAPQFSINSCNGTMVSTWETTAAAETITLPLRTGYGYDMIVDWGDGSTSEVTSDTDADRVHTYATAGTHTITINGLQEAWYFNSGGDKDKIRTVPNLGNTCWTSFGNMFRGASQLTTVAGGDTSEVTSMAYAFDGAILVTPDTSGWDTSQVTSMTYTFNDAQSANPDVSGWDTSKVTNMFRMFQGAYLATPDTSGWDTSLVTRMDRMFFRAYAANPDTSGWNTSSVTNMSYMFQETNNANPDVSNWDVSSVTTLAFMFRLAAAATPDVSNWVTSNVLDMSNMFREMDANPDVSGWDTSKVTSMYAMFFSNSLANPDVSNWDVSKVENIGSMFNNAPLAFPDVSNWVTSSVTYMRAVFQLSNSNPDVSGWDTSSVTNMNTMFISAVNANPDVSNWDTSAVTDMASMFQGASVANPDMSNWDISSATLVTNLLVNSGISNSNYSSFLIMADNTSTAALSMGSTIPAFYQSSAAAARASLVNDGWTIVDLGPE